MNYIVIDQGTSSTKAFLFNSKGIPIHQNSIKHELFKPKPFHIESDPIQIVRAVKILLEEMINKSGHVIIHKVGMAVQRSTFLFWGKNTINPLTRAISWQDTRAQNIVENIENYRKEIWEITGAPLSPHFGGPKFLFITQNNKFLRSQIDKGNVFFGPLSAFIIHSITGTASIDNSIACRTLLYDINKGKWSNFLLDLFQVPKKCLPRLVPIQYKYGNILKTKIPLCTVIGDQQAALIGHQGGGLAQHSLSANFGTSGSILYNTGTKPQIISGLISSILYSEKNKTIFMIEGTINACNSIFYHLEKTLRISHNKMQWNKRANATNTNGIFIPGFNGLAAPYWKAGFRDIYIDLDNDPNQIIRAAMESIVFLANDIIKCLGNANIKLTKKITVSGGGARTSLLQFLADVTEKEINHYLVKDQTATGVYILLNINDFNGDNAHVFDKKFFPKKQYNIVKKKENWLKAIKKFNLNLSSF